MLTVNIKRRHRTFGGASAAAEALSAAMGERVFVFRRDRLHGGYWITPAGLNRVLHFPGGDSSEWLFEASITSTAIGRR